MKRQFNRRHFLRGTGANRFAVPGQSFFNSISADRVLTTRERLAAHMEEAQCASCHRRIDPIGSGLENFDAAGKWRITDEDLANEIVSSAKNKQFAAREFFHALVRSEAFQKK